MSKKEGLLAGLLDRYLDSLVDHPVAHALIGLALVGFVVSALLS